MLRRTLITVSLVLAVAGGATAADMTNAAPVDNGDELLLVQRLHANGRYVKPSELLRH